MTSPGVHDSTTDQIMVPVHDEQSFDISEKKSSTFNYIESCFSMICRNNEILIMPKVISDCGLVGGLATLVIISFITFFVSYGLCKSAQKYKVKSIIELCLKVFPRGSFAFNSFLLTLMVSSILCSQLLVVDIISEIFRIKNVNSILSNSYIIIAVLNICMLFFSYSKTLHRVKVFSNIAFACYIFAMLMIAIHYFTPFYGKDIKPEPNANEVVMWNANGILSNIGLLLFSFTVQDVIIDFDSEIKPQSNERSRKFTFFITLGMLINYTFAGLLGYLSILRDPVGNDQENYLRYLIHINNGTSKLLILSNLMVCLNLLFDSVVCLIPITKFIDIFLLRSNRNIRSVEDTEDENSTKSHIIKVSIALLIAGLLILIVYFDLDVQGVYEITGSICIIPITIAFPLYFYSICFPESISKPILLILMGVTLLLWGVTAMGCLPYLQGTAISGIFIK